MTMKPYYIASCSGGKDSLAMVLKLLEYSYRYPLDEVVFYDTGMEFLSVYGILDELKFIVQAKYLIKFTVLKPKCPFEYKMFEKPVNVGKPNEHKGYSWCGGRCRWGTTEKLVALDRYCEEKNAFCYVGIAADETKRLEKERKEYKIFPLQKWGMTEADCLDFCRERNFSWKEVSERSPIGLIDLYDILDRVSCWCCANKNLWELRNIWYYLPNYWEQLKRLQSKTDRPFKNKGSIFELEQLFEKGYTPKRRKR